MISWSPIQTRYSYILRFFHSYHNNIAHLQGEETGKSSSRRQEEKDYYLAFQDENSKPLCSSNLISPFLKEDLCEREGLFDVEGYFGLGCGFLFGF